MHCHLETQLSWGKCLAITGHKLVLIILMYFSAFILPPTKQSAYSIIGNRNASPDHNTKPSSWWWINATWFPLLADLSPNIHPPICPYFYLAFITEDDIVPISIHCLWSFSPTPQKSFPLIFLSNSHLFLHYPSEISFLIQEYF